MQAWLKAGGVPGAVFVVNDQAALGAVQAIEAASLRVGSDIAIVGAGNVTYGEMLRVPLTTVTWARSLMGEQAATLLIQLIQGELPGTGSRNVVLPLELIVRNSCGANAVTTAGIGFAARPAPHR
jgi:LacI family transcriptional regulator